MKKLIIMTLISASTIFASNIKIENSYVRATPPSLPNSAAFMSIKNDTKKDIKLLSAKSNVSKAVELHTHDMKDGIMKMYQVQKINIPAHDQVNLKPGGFHIMLIGLNNPLKEGENINLTLEFSNGEVITVKSLVKKVISGMKHHKHHDHKH